MNQFTATVNATEYPPQLKHKVIFETFDGLKPKEAMLLINDHDPRPLRYQFESIHAGAYTWEYLEEGPETFRVKISKL
ncbi:MAG: DUF2249 domain-containing protein [Bacilli bacterium]